MHSSGMRFLEDYEILIRVKIKLKLIFSDFKFRNMLSIRNELLAQLFALLLVQCKDIFFVNITRSSSIVIICRSFQSANDILRIE